MINLWIDEGFEEASEEMKKAAEEKKKKCGCGRVVCCGKHKGGRCSCNRENQKERS